MRRTRSVGNGAMNAAVNAHGQRYGHALRPPRAPGRHAARAACTSAAARIGTLQWNIACRSAPSETACETSSGRRAATARAKCPPRLWPMTATRRPDARVQRDDAPLHALERPLGAVGVERRSRRPPAGSRSAAASRRARRACGRRRRSRGRARRRARPRAGRRGRARPGRSVSRAASSSQRVSPTWSPHQRPVGTGSVMPPARRCPAPSRSPCGRGCRAAWARARARRRASSSQAM